MKIIEFPTYESYIKSQRRAAGRKGWSVYFTDTEIRNIANWLVRNNNPAREAVCHGSRAGLEIGEFKVHFPSLNAFGTDLFPILHHDKRKNRQGWQYHKFEKVIEWDFSKHNPEWVGRFDFVYSTSLDHARDPLVALKEWMVQLNRYGSLFLQWSRGHMKVGGGDCVGFDLLELIEMCNEVGIVMDLLYNKTISIPSNIFRHRALETITVVVGKKPDEENDHGS
jgi:hypothetical protein